MTVLGLVYVQRLNFTVFALTTLLLVGYGGAKSLGYTRSEPGMRNIAALLQAEAKAGQITGITDKRIAEDASQSISNDTSGVAEVYVVDWKFCEDYINPEVYGLAYYGFELQPNLIPVKELEDWVKNRPGTRLLPLGKLVIVGFGSTVNPLRDYLTLRGRAFEIREFGRRSLLTDSLKLVRVEAED